MAGKCLPPPPLFLNFLSAPGRCHCYPRQTNQNKQTAVKNKMSSDGKPGDKESE